MVKGEIWWANLPTNPYGSEPGKRRHVLIIQSVINFSQIITVDKSRLTEQVSMLPKNHIEKINEIIRHIFDT